MEITYLGHSSFKISGKNGKVVTDPFDPSMLGIKFPKVEADIVTISHHHHDHDQYLNVGGNPIVLTGSGEYEIKGIKVVGLGSYHDQTNGQDRGKNTVYRLEVDGVSVVHLGDLGHKLDDKQLDILDGVDILMVPVGGFFSLDAKQAAEVISQLEPKIVIPMHYHFTGINENNFGKLAAVDLFIKEVGKENITPVPKLTVSKDKLPVEQTIVVLA